LFILHIEKTINKRKIIVTLSNKSYKKICIHNYHKCKVKYSDLRVILYLLFGYKREKQKIESKRN
jgi:hypothetical protein